MSSDTASSTEAGSAGRRVAEISVVIPTYNRPHYLMAAVRSALSQSPPPREVIVVDNGTEPLSPDLLSEFGTSVQLIRQEPGGVQRARNAGIRAATSDWIATLDDDDAYDPGFLEHVGPAVADGRADIVFADHRKIRGNLSDRRTNFETAPIGYWDGVPRAGPDGWTFVGHFPVERLLSFIAFYPSSMVIRRDLFEKVGGYDEGVRGIATEDIEFLVRALSQGKLAVVWKPLVRYRVHDSNTAGGPARQRIGRWRIFEFIARHPRTEVAPHFYGAVAANLPARRADIFDFAFHKGLFEIVQEVRGSLQDGLSVRRRVYSAIADLREPWRTPLAMLVGAPRRALNRLVRIARPEKHLRTFS